MFLTKLYRFHKPVFIVCIILLIGFLWINYKWGMVASPLTHYGMYSGKYAVHDSFSMYQIFVNGQQVDQKKLSVIERDLIQSFPSFFINEKVGNEAVFKTMVPYLSKMQFTNRLNPENFRNHATAAMYLAWYKNKLEKILHTHIDALEIKQQNYQWVNKHLQALGQAKIISII